MISFKLGLASKIIKVTCFDEFSKEYCKDFIVDEAIKEDFEVKITKEDLIKEKELECNKGAYGSVELSAMYRKIVTRLALDNTLLFHCSAICYNGKAYCFAAHSGVGKSTHVRLLMEAIGKDKISYINDDKPLFKFDGDKIEVYGTPWNGKERKSLNVDYPLGGIALLSRGKENSISQIEGKAAYNRILEQIYLPPSKLELISVLGLIDKLLTSAPIYELKANMDLSAGITSFKAMMERN